MSGAIELERRDAIAVVTLRNERKKNALDPAMLDALVDALGRLPADGARAVVLTGAGDVFSSGYDLSALPTGAVPAANPLGPALAAIAGGALPVVAALNGAAIGGGCELAATCDLRVAHDAVTLMMPPVRLGLVYAPTGLARFVALCGLSRTRELFLPAAPVLATEMARGAPLAVAGTRRALELLMPRVDGDGLAELARLMQEAWLSED